MKHENSIAIQVLSDQYLDYPLNAWHYDREYRSIVSALEIQEKGQARNYSIENKRIVLTKP